MSSLNSKNFSTNLSSSTGDNLPLIENETKPFLQNQKMGMTGEYREVIESLQEMLEDCFSDAGDFADLLKQAMEE